MKAERRKEHSTGEKKKFLRVEKFKNIYVDLGYERWKKEKEERCENEIFIFCWWQSVTTRNETIAREVYAVPFLWVCFSSQLKRCRPTSPMRSFFKASFKRLQLKEVLTRYHFTEVEWKILSRKAT